MRLLSWVVMGYAKDTKQKNLETQADMKQGKKDVMFVEYLWIGRGCFVPVAICESEFHLDIQNSKRNILEFKEFKTSFTFG